MTVYIAMVNSWQSSQNCSKWLVLLTAAKPAAHYNNNSGIHWVFRVFHARKRRLRKSSKPTHELPYWIGIVLCVPVRWELGIQKKIFVISKWHSVLQVNGREIMPFTNVLGYPFGRERPRLSVLYSAERIHLLHDRFSTGTGLQNCVLKLRIIPQL